jgi:hypothetical protein
MVEDDFFLEQVCIVLQNLHAFYSQFISLVDTTIADQRKPIEKELRNFVQVARWNDMNYWSLKHTIQKAHRTIHRHMKQLEVCFLSPKFFGTCGWGQVFFSLHCQNGIYIFFAFFRVSWIKRSA